MSSCHTCGADWAAGEAAPACRECGGHALERPCCRCDGECGSTWRRMIDDSHDSGESHWAGSCSGPADAWMDAARAQVERERTPRTLLDAAELSDRLTVGGDDDEAWVASRTVDARAAAPAFVVDTERYLVLPIVEGLKTRIADGSVRAVRVTFPAEGARVACEPGEGANPDRTERAMRALGVRGHRWVTL